MSQSDTGAGFRVPEKTILLFFYLCVHFGSGCSNPRKVIFNMLVHFRAGNLAKNVNFFPELLADFGEKSSKDAIDFEEFFEIMIKHVSAFQTAV